MELLQRHVQEPRRERYASSTKERGRDKFCGPACERQSRIISLDRALRYRDGGRVALDRRKGREPDRGYVVGRELS